MFTAPINTLEPVHCPPVRLSGRVQGYQQTKVKI